MFAWTNTYMLHASYKEFLFLVLTIRVLAHYLCSSLFVGKERLRKHKRFWGNIKSISMVPQIAEISSPADFVFIINYMSISFIQNLT
jgi:hypothetical protein